MYQIWVLGKNVTHIVIVCSKTPSLLREQYYRHFLLNQSPQKPGARIYLESVQRDLSNGAHFIQFCTVKILWALFCLSLYANELWILSMYRLMGYQLLTICCQYCHPRTTWQELKLSFQMSFMQARMLYTSIGSISNSKALQLSVSFVMAFTLVLYIGDIYLLFHSLVNIDTCLLSALMVFFLFSTFLY